MEAHFSPIVIQVEAVGRVLWSRGWGVERRHARGYGRRRQSPLCHNSL